VTFEKADPPPPPGGGGGGGGGPPSPLSSVSSLYVFTIRAISEIRSLVSISAF